MAEQAFERSQDSDRSFGDILSDETAMRDGKGQVIANSILPGPGDLFFAGSRYATSRRLNRSVEIRKRRRNTISRKSARSASKSLISLCLQPVRGSVTSS